MTRRWVPLELDLAVDPHTWAELETTRASAGVALVDDSAGAEATTLMLAAAARDARGYDLPKANNVHVTLAYMPGPLGRVLITLRTGITAMFDAVVGSLAWVQ